MRKAGLILYHSILSIKLDQTEKDPENYLLSHFLFLPFYSDINFILCLKETGNCSCRNLFTAEKYLCSFFIRLQLNQSKIEVSVISLILKAN